MALILVIEDDVALRDILVDSLTQALGAEVVGLGHIDHAAMVLNHKVPDIILCDLNLPERSGLELLDELDSRQLTTPVVFISGYLPAYRPYIPQREGLVLLAKPFELETLLEHVGEVIAPINEAAEAPFGLFDYVQLSCVGGHTVEVNVFGVDEDADLIGRVVILGGQMWSTQDSQGTGSDAFLRLACLPESRVTCNAILQTSLPRNIQSNWDALLLRAATLRDDVTERMQRGFDEDTPVANPWFPGPVERPTFTGPPPGYVAENPPEEIQDGGIAPQSFDAPATQPSAPERAGVEPVPMAPSVSLELSALTPQTPDPVVPTATVLDDFLQAAAQAEAQGNVEQALAYLEQAMVQFPGHPEILLTALRLKGL